MTDIRDLHETIKISILHKTITLNNIIYFQRPEGTSLYLPEMHLFDYLHVFVCLFVFSWVYFDALLQMFRGKDKANGIVKLEPTMDGKVIFPDFFMKNSTTFIVTYLPLYTDFGK